MTTNQINFAKLQEEKRSNLANEAIKGRSIDEDTRHNLETERTNWYSATTNRMVGQTQAAASMLGSQAAMSNAATRSAELEQKRYEYENTGKVKDNAWILNMNTQTRQGQYQNQVNSWIEPELKAKSGLISDAIRGFILPMAGMMTK